MAIMGGHLSMQTTLTGLESNIFQKKLKNHRKQKIKTIIEYKHKIDNVWILLY